MVGLAGAVLALVHAGDLAASDPPEGWTAAAPRDEIRPDFAYNPKGGPDGSGSFIIEADQREGLDGYWVKTFPIVGGRHYRFEAFRKVSGVALPRRSAVVRVLWQDDQGRLVPNDTRTITDAYRGGGTAMARAEHPTDKPATRPGWTGWTEVSGTYHVPTKATQAAVELHLQWAPGGRIEWSGVSLRQTPAPPGRKVRLATVHFRPRGGKTPEGNCRLFAPLVEEAAKQKADLVVLPETLTFYGTGMTAVEVAEPVPGPTTEYFGELAKKHDLYIVVGMFERAGHLVHNVAVLVGPDGQVVGKYRKVTLPRDEIAWGVTPGSDYPVFDTRFGKVGMMICYDGFFPEVARELSNRGAEVIAWPVWGCNPMLGAARACENHVYVVSSTYTDVSANWMISAVYGRDGKPLAQAKNWGDVVVTEIDLNKPLHWQSLGDFRAQLPRHRPVAVGEGK
jgi:predicted amidohydrolase